MLNADFVNSGYEAARQLASRANASHANEFVVTTIGNDVPNTINPLGKINPARTIRRQERCRRALHCGLPRHLQDFHGEGAVGATGCATCDP